MVSYHKEKLDPTILFKCAKSATGSDLKSSDGGSEFGKKVVDDPFAGMIARGKKRNDDFAASSKSNKPQYPIILSQVCDIA